jgi:hypothetical protein
MKEEDAAIPGRHGINGATDVQTVGDTSLH